MNVTPMSAPGAESGRTMWREICHDEAPTSRALSISESDISRSTDESSTVMKGSESQTWVMTIPFQSKTIFGKAPSGNPNACRMPSTNPWFARKVIIA